MQKLRCQKIWKGSATSGSIDGTLLWDIVAGAPIIIHSDHAREKLFDVWRACCRCRHRLILAANEWPCQCVTVIPKHTYAQYRNRQGARHVMLPAAARILSPTETAIRCPHPRVRITRPSYSTGQWVVHPINALWRISYGPGVGWHIKVLSGRVCTVSEIIAVTAISRARPALPLDVLVALR
eukprot:6193941-Pleurochrysis_carterae.AAC.3